jgi:hypothetical protein
MKYIKAYESKKMKLSPGDIVKIIPPEEYLDIIKNFLNNNVGVIFEEELEDGDENNDYFYNVKYDNVPPDLIIYTRYMGESPGLKEIGEIFTSDDTNTRLATPQEIKDYKANLASKKYNL